MNVKKKILREKYNYNKKKKQKKKKKKNPKREKIF